MTTKLPWTHMTVLPGRSRDTFEALVYNVTECDRCGGEAMEPNAVTITKPGWRELEKLGLTLKFPMPPELYVREDGEIYCENCGEDEDAM